STRRSGHRGRRRKPADHGDSEFLLFDRNRDGGADQPDRAAAAADGAAAGAVNGHREPAPMARLRMRYATIPAMRTTMPYPSRRNAPAGQRSKKTKPAIARSTGNGYSGMRKGRDARGSRRRNRIRPSAWARYWTNNWIATRAAMTWSRRNTQKAVETRPSASRATQGKRWRG